MTANTWRILKLTAQTGLIKGGAKKPENLVKYAIEHDTDPEEIELFRNKQAALKAFEQYKGNDVCEVIQGFAGAFYQVTAYVVEEYEADEDGEFIEGSDYYSSTDALED